MNIQNLMAQAQRVQKELERANNEIENTFLKVIMEQLKLSYLVKMRLQV